MNNLLKIFIFEMGLSAKSFKAFRLVQLGRNKFRDNEPVCTSSSSTAPPGSSPAPKMLILPRRAARKRPSDSEVFRSFRKNQMLYSSIIPIKPKKIRGKSFLSFITGKGQHKRAFIEMKAFLFFKSD